MKQFKVEIPKTDFEDILAGCKSYILVQPTLNVKLGDQLELRTKFGNIKKSHNTTVSHLCNITPTKTIVSFNY